MWNEIKRIDDEAENVAKFVYTKDDAVVESVLYKYPTYEERTVICCSTQSGCPVGCRFCGAGDYFVRNMTSEEIVDQVDYSIEQTSIKAEQMKKLQVMFMSQGEPLLNLNSLIPAMRILYDKYPDAKLLISTSGPSIKTKAWWDLLDVSIDIPNIGLQFSVHESTNEARNNLVPFKAKMTLEDMAAHGLLWYLTMKLADKNPNVVRNPFFNYCAHEGNSSDEDADRLFKLYNPKVFNATVSVICEREQGMSKTNDKQRQLAVDFSSKLLERGYDVRVFDPAGQDTIGGGCGQLHFVQDWFKENPDKVRKSIGYGRSVIHAPT